MNAFFKLYCRAYQTVFRLALPVLPYREPRILGELKDLPLFLQQQEISAVLLITDKPLRALDMTRGLENDLSAHGIACAVFDDVVPNPTVQNVEDCRAAYLESGAQAMIAFGGDSVMDCAKAAGARVARPGKPVQKMGGLLKVLRKTPMLIAVPTTSGTGSEATLVAVVANPEKHVKIGRASCRERV